MIAPRRCQISNGRTRFRQVSSRVLLAGVIALLAGDAFATGVAAPSFRITDIGTLGGSWSYGSDINAQGWVVGLSGDHGFLYDGTLHDLGSFDLGSINASGQMTGNSGHVYQFDGTLHILGTLPGNANGIGGINDSGQVAGTHPRPDGGVYATLCNFNDGTLQDLGTLGVGFGGFSSAEAINNQGQVAGRSGGGLQHAFLYDGAMHDLGTLGGTESAAGGINAFGFVVGWSKTAAGAYHAFLYDTKMRDLGTLGGNSFAHSINSIGRVTGRSFTSRGDEHAFLYDSSNGMRDLNALIDHTSGWVLQSATGINDAGQITGFGTIGGETHAFLLTPIPEPAAVQLFVTAIVVALASVTWRCRNGDAFYARAAGDCAAPHQRPLP